MLGIISQSIARRFLITPDAVNGDLYYDLSLAPAGFWNAVRSDGGDIRVTTETGVECPREVAAFNFAGKTGSLFIGTSGGTAFWVYYGNPNAVEPGVGSTYGRNNVWDGNYAGVWHLDDVTSPIDSTGQNDGTRVLGANAIGKVGGGLDLSTGNAYVWMLKKTSLAISTDLTISAWIKCASTGVNRILASIVSYPPYYGYEFCVNGPTQLGFWSDTKAGYAIGNTNVTDNVWHHVIIALDNTVARFYVDGNPDGTPSSSRPSATSDVGSLTCIGSVVNGGDGFNGLLDEIRLSKVARSAQWIANEYANQNNPAAFWATGSEEVVYFTFSNVLNSAIDAISSAAEDVAATDHGILANTAVDYWVAAPSYEYAFAADCWYAFTGYPDFFTANQIRDLYMQFVNNKNVAGELPIAYLARGILFHSGRDLIHAHATGDGAFFIPQMARLFYEKTGDITNFQTIAATLKTALGLIPRNGTSKLVKVDLGADEWVPWGFHDGQRPSGDVMMGSVLYWKACTDMAYLYDLAADTTNRDYFLARAAEIAASIDTLWSADDGMFLAATGQNAQIDICGSAYAVYVGLVTGAKATAISTYLVAHAATLTLGGYVRQSPTYWAETYTITGDEGGTPGGMPAGAGDDGYWSVHTEWVAYCMALTNTAAAQKLIMDFAANADKTMEWYSSAGGADGFTDNLESPMGPLAFVRKNPVLFRCP